MKWLTPLRVISSVLIVMIAALPAAYAEKGRDFSASYDLKDEAPVGANRVSVTVSLRLQNHSGADIADAEVSLEGNVPALKNLGVFPVRLSLANHQLAKLSGTFIVPTQYLTQWRSGQKPHVVVCFISAPGHRVRRPVELRFVPGVGR